MSTIEIIPDEDKVFCRVFKGNIVEGEIFPRAFDPTPYDTPNGLSVNWCKYATAEQTKNQVAPTKNPADYAVVSFIAGKIRNVGSIDVIHDPVENNSAHSLIIGIPPRKAKNPTITRKLQEQAQQSWEIQIQI